jgi:hypothetical protein
MLKRILGPKRDEVTMGWRKLHNKTHNVLYCSSNIVGVIKLRGMKWAVYVARTGERRAVYWVLVENHKGKRPLGSHRLNWEDNIKMFLIIGMGRLGLD